MTCEAPAQNKCNTVKQPLGWLYLSPSEETHIRQYLNVNKIDIEELLARSIAQCAATLLYKFRENDYKHSVHNTPSSPEINPNSYRLGYRIESDELVEAFRCIHSFNPEANPAQMLRDIVFEYISKNNLPVSKSVQTF